MPQFIVALGPDLFNRLRCLSLHVSRSTRAKVGVGDSEDQFLVACAWGETGLLQLHMLPPCSGQRGESGLLLTPPLGRSDWDYRIGRRIRETALRASGRWR